MRSDDHVFHLPQRVIVGQRFLRRYIETGTADRSGFQRFHQDRFACEVDFNAWAFLGDSANDEPMFGAFGLGVGVANVARFLPRMTHHPNWITTRPGGMGFVEAMDRILTECS